MQMRNLNLIKDSDFYFGVRKLNPSDGSGGVAKTLRQFNQRSL